LAKRLKIGKRYSLTAISGYGAVFSNWSGDITSAKNPLIFVFQSNMVLQANFVSNPFEYWQGTYNGLFAMRNGVTEETAGMLRGLTIRQKGIYTEMPSQKGTYSGTLLINGGSDAISGSFDLAGLATNQISRPVSQGGPLILKMALLTDFLGGQPLSQVAGTVSGTDNGLLWVADLTAYHYDGGSSSQYDISPVETMLIPPDANNDPPNSSPGGYGYALITYGWGRGTATITGALADGSAFSQSASLPLPGSFPVYANLYANKGLLIGWINLDLKNTNGVNLTRIHPPRKSGMYPNGFTNVLESQIPQSAWRDGWDGAPPQNTILSMTNLSIPGAFGVITTINVSTATPYKVIGSSVSGTINPNTGLLTMTIGNGATKVTGHGVILLNATNGGGYFLTKTNSQAFKLRRNADLEWCECQDNSSRFCVETTFTEVAVPFQVTYE
jgi:hypothetical protein